MRWYRTAVILLLLPSIALLPLLSGQAGAQDREAVVQQLFSLNRQLEETRAALSDLEQRVQEVSARQAEAQARYDQLEAERLVRKERYGRRLRIYREQGSRAPILLLFSAKSLADFLWRLDALQQILEYDARLARELQELQAAVRVEESTLADARSEVERLRAEQQERAAELERAIAEQEAILASLGDERQEVETALAAVEQDWQVSAQPVLEALGTALQEMGTGQFEPDDLRVTFLPPGAVVTISEQTLNDYFHGHPALANLEVSLSADELELAGTFEAVPVQIAGGFSVLPTGLLRFEPTMMQVREFTLPEDVIGQIVAEGQLDIDISDVVQPLSLRAIQVTDGVMTLRAGM